MTKMKTIGFTITVKNKIGEFKRYDISEDVYYYIKQLEGYIKDPDSSSIKQRYDKRFSAKGDTNGLES